MHKPKAKPERLIYGYTQAEWSDLTQEERYLKTGHLAPSGECSMCDRFRTGDDPMMPHHEASDRCQSGKRSHCTCDTCY